ncbi:hypothetical protein SAMN06265338_13313 [Rhodoblastus acidophilus]|uniref:Uncharacterized protein n=1 Tax=Rhodoblastus acidophilus TaxID=1074 RepID=A0A212SF32_RHOAC|nr:hypothetical protein SAMN06265338_13313 [Rhodoblastus acidophilus]
MAHIAMRTVAPGDGKHGERMFRTRQIGKKREYHLAVAPHTGGERNLSVP